MALATGPLIERGRPSPTARRPKRVDLTEENIRRIFGMSMFELFKKLAEKFGYQIED